MLIVVSSSPGFATLVLFKEAFVFVDVFSRKIYTDVIASPLSLLWCLSNPCHSVLGRSAFLPCWLWLIFSCFECPPPWCVGFGCCSANLAFWFVRFSFWFGSLFGLSLQLFCSFGGFAGCFALLQIWIWFCEFHTACPYLLCVCLFLIFVENKE